MISLNDLTVKRLIIHTISAKESSQDSASITASNQLITVGRAEVEVLKTRLIEAAGRNSKAFELEIEKTDPESFFYLTSDLLELTDREFIERTISVAEKLAECQRRSSIPGGYFLFLECVDDNTGLPAVIVIKADLHEALRLIKEGANIQVKVLTEIFLSPSQKLYKIGIIYQKPSPSVEGPKEYGCFLYDDQFRSDTHPAEYFYKEFLGFTVGNNGKIQSQRFYEKTEAFIISNISASEIKFDLLSALKTEFRANQNPTISPRTFANTYFNDDADLKARYISDVCSELPLSIVKDVELLKTKLNRRKIEFPKNINLYGPEDGFDQHVEIVTDLSELDSTASEYTIIKILGKPYPNE